MEKEAEVEPAWKEADEEEDRPLEEAPLDEWTRMVAAVRRPGTGFPVRDHREGLLRTLHDSFTGAEAVEWLTRHWPNTSREQALELAQRLCDAGTIVPTSKENRTALEEGALYRFSERQRRVVVVGGGFAGRKVARKLQSSFHVTLVDTKDHFLCTLSLPACLCNIDHLDKIITPHSSYLQHGTVLADEVVGVNREANTIELKSHGALPYDYLVLCTGSRYKLPVAGNDKVVVVDPLSPARLRENYERLAKAKSVAIIGAGPVGIELAGEIIHYLPDKQVTVVYSGKKMLHRYCKGAHQSVKKFFNATANVRVIKDQKVIDVDDDCLVTSEGERIKADVAYFCVGFVPNTEFLRAGCADLLSETGHIKVNEHFQVEGHPNIFALGDVADIPEDKLAQNAEIHAGVVIKNIKAFAHGKSLSSYKPSTRILIISIGPKRAMVIRGDTVYVDNGLGARLKTMVEYKSIKGWS